MGTCKPFRLWKNLVLNEKCELNMHISCKHLRTKNTLYFNFSPFTDRRQGSKGQRWIMAINVWNKPKLLLCRMLPSEKSQFRRFSADKVRRRKEMGMVELKSGFKPIYELLIVAPWFRVGLCTIFVALVCDVTWHKSNWKLSPLHSRTEQWMVYYAIIICSR